MHQNLKKYISVFFLLLFLFPLAEKELHAFEHSDDIHCSESDKHFHSLEHHCSICSFTFTSSEEPIEIADALILFSSTFSYTPSINCVYELNTIDHSGSRAPPII
jgi:hypothetical protein